MANIFNVLTLVTYWVLIALWSFILYFYIKKMWDNKTKRLFLTLIIILSIDAFRTLFESIYFGAWYTSLSGIIQKQISLFLEKPELVVIPKLINLIAAIVVIILLLKRWIPDKEKEVAKVKGALQESEEKYRLVFETAANLITSVDQNGILVDCNNRIEEVLGYKREEVIGQHIGMIIHSNYHAVANKAFEELVTTKALHNNEFKMVRKDGRIIDVSINSSSITDKQKNFVRSICIVEDITERKQAEKALRESEEKFKTLINQTTEGIGLATLDGKYVFVNPAFCKMSGYSKEELLNLTVFDMKSKNQDHSSFDKSKESLEGLPVEVNLQRKDKTEYMTEIIGNVISIGDEKFVLGTIRDITERKQAEIALEKSNNTIRQERNMFTEGAVVIIKWKNHPDWPVEYVSPNVKKVLGYSVDELLKGEVNYKNIVNSKEVERIAEEANCSGQNDINRFEHKPYQITRKDGKTIWIADYTTIIRNEEGVITHFLGYIIDITTHKQAEEELRRYECIVSSSNDMLALLDNNFVYLAANKKYAESFGMTPNDLIGLTVSDIFGKKVFKDVIYPRGIKCMQGEEIRFQKWAEFPIAGKKYMEVTFTPYYDSENIIKGIVVNGRDVTDRKKAEEANTRLSRAIEHADETIMITDAERNIQYINPAFEKTTGYTIKDAIGKNPRFLKSDHHDEEFYKNMWETLSNGNQWHGELTNKKKDGTLYIENVVISPVFDSKNKIINYVAVKNDITETKRLQQLESRAARLELAGTIAGQVAHDFNNLLAPIMAYPEFIREDLPHDHITQTYLKTIEEAAKKIADINQDLLTMGRRGHYNQEVINLNTIVLHTIKEMDSRTDTVKCETNLCEDIMKIKGGPSQIHRMITNLLVNGQDAMQNNGTLHIKTENYYVDDTSIAFGLVPKGEYVKLTVTDSGCGIPDDIIQNILDPFFSTKKADKKSGSGLGLSVVDAVIKDHNGYLDLSSKVGKGTSFYLYFPVTRDDVEEIKSTLLRGGTEKILVVDDDDVQREVSTKLLKKLGYEVCSINSGKKAVEFLHNNPQDLIILDMIMPPGIDGAETYKQILKINSQQKAIIVSGFSESDRVLEAQKLGVGAFVKKPITKTAIAAAIRTELDRNAEIFS